METTAIRTCPLCEATCGLSLTLIDGEVTRIRGDRDDVFSAGFLCPKGTTLHHLHNDPDRLTQPLVKRGGQHVPVSWDEAWAVVDAGFNRVIDQHGRGALGAYAGNPNVHNLGAALYLRGLLKSLGSPHVYSASTVDQRPKEISSGLMFGTGGTIAVPDVDRTHTLLMLGANPLASNGSLATAPDWPGRLSAIVDRGGDLIVVDPKRTKTAALATQHLAIRPGTDPLLLAALINELFRTDTVDLGTVSEFVKGVDDLRAAVEPFTADAVAPVTGIAAADIVDLAERLAMAPTAVAYGRIGTTVSPLGTVGSWLVDALNLCLGSFDQPGGAMFALPAAGGATTRGRPRYGRGTTIGRRTSRVRGYPDSFGEFPVATLADEITTPGDGQIHALITLAGNPVLSTPDSNVLDDALDQLDFMVAIDIYLNETTRHADVILPAPSALEKSHYDLAFYGLSIRNVANYSPPVIERADGQPDEWEVFARLTAIVAGFGLDVGAEAVDDQMIDAMIDRAVADEHSSIHGRDRDEIAAALGDRRGPERLLDFMLRTGPWGDAFGTIEPDGDGWRGRMSLDALLEHPSGIDLGPLEPRVPEVLRQPDGMIDIAPASLVDDLARRGQRMLDVDHDGLLLIGRRDLRSNNSWMHNVRVLVKGKDRCTLQINPADAERVGLVDGATAKVTSRVGSVEVTAELTGEMMPGVVSMPHGWGHDLDGAQLATAADRPGVNSNVLTDSELIDEFSGTSVLNGIPVEVVTA